MTHTGTSMHVFRHPFNIPNTVMPGFDVLWTGPGEQSMNQERVAIGSRGWAISRLRPPRLAV
jgi:hypothetical protein